MIFLVQSTTPYLKAFHSSIVPGWTLNNARLLADHYAKEADATVYLPDLYVSLFTISNCYGRILFNAGTVLTMTALMATW